MEQGSADDLVHGVVAANVLGADEDFAIAHENAAVSVAGGGMQGGSRSIFIFDCVKGDELAIKIKEFLGRFFLLAVLVTTD